MEAEPAHHSCGLLFGILHDDGDLLFDIADEVISDAFLGVQNGATNVDAGKEKMSPFCSLPIRILLLFKIVYSSPGGVLQRVQIPAL